ncbi:L-arabinose isomerase [Poriferisphaera corsica]|uniref:L-arabinose isomerase n=1 Tax=Poriferisphaera corsica TaxID=2528020 RepID=A0A517YSM7_9BACT|nr:L-arabinose isomerase [Poriferisphaera corsica]QDU33237.1 L-arabinose isomerase [Poriferisphaera corsica]
MLNLAPMEIWFLTGSQHLYGDELLGQVDQNAKHIVKYLNQDTELPAKIVHKPVLTGSDAIQSIILEANQSNQCIGLITWMHTFSPAKMWIRGLSKLNKPLVHLHTQYNVSIPWDTIDMDYMNLHQSAHGGREFGHICTRMRIKRKVIVGHWKDKSVQQSLESWIRAAVGWHDSNNMKIARFGDNMRDVAVTEGDKVEAERIFGYSVNGYGLGDLIAHIDTINKTEIKQLCEVYADEYSIDESLSSDGVSHNSLLEIAKIELGLRSFLTAGNFTAFTDTFENLHGLKQLPGLAVQRLMNDGYGFGAEGDWKHAALVRTMKVMAYGLDGGTSFMEDYTYHLDQHNEAVLGSHMLEICPSISNEKPRCEIYPLGIGGKADPVRLIFNAMTGPAVNASVIDLGNRFRLLLNQIDSIEPDFNLPKLPVARVLWLPQPDLKTSATAWIYAGGAHHTCLSFALNQQHIRDFAQIADVELAVIDQHTNINQFNNELRFNDLAYGIQMK